MDPSIREITLQWCAQNGGKTALLIGLIAWLAAEDPCPIGYGLPDDRLIKRVFERKIYPVLDASPATHDLLLPEHQWRHDFIDLKKALVYGVPSGSPAALGELSIRVLIGDEVDKWSRKKTGEADAMLLFEKRPGAYWDYKKIWSSTPKEEGASRIQTKADASDKRTFRVPCPHCGEHQALRFEQLELVRGDDGRLAPANVQLKKARYLCEHCGKAIPDHVKPKMLRAGVWARQGEGVRPDGSLFVEDESQLIVGDHAGFIELNRLYAPNTTFGQVAAEWVKALAIPGGVQDFVNSWLARVYAPKSRRATEEQVLFHRGIESGLTYQRGVCPEMPLACLLLVDVQDDCLWWKSVAWCFAKREFLLRYGQAPGDLEAALELARMTYQTPDGETFGHSHCLMDSRHRGDEVLPFCLRHGFIPTQGVDSTNRVQPLTWSKGEGGIQIMSITTLPFKDALLRKIQSDDLEGPGCWRLPADTGMDYARQLTAERRTLSKNKATGQMKVGWTRTRDDNHFWDLGVMSQAAALALEWQGLDFYSQPIKSKVTRSKRKRDGSNRGATMSDIRQRLGTHRPMEER